MPPVIFLPAAFFCKGGANLTHKIRRLLRCDRGEANYFSTVVYIFVAVLLIAFILNVFSIISAKQQIDHAADQMVKQIQLSGGLNSDTDELFDFLSGNISGARNLSYAVDASYLSSRPSGMLKGIQLGVPFYVTITADVNLGGFWNLDLIHIRIQSKGAGVSEIYWKE